MKEASTSPVKLFWHRSLNFGDMCSPYIIEKLTGKQPDTVLLPTNDEPNLIAIGSLLNSTAIARSTVWGAGFVEPPDAAIKPKRICAVRGKLTKDIYTKYKIECPDVFGDPAVLLPLYYRPKVSKQYAIGFTPHVQDYVEAVQKYKDDVDVIIDLQQGVEKVIDQILACRLIISTCLHGLIVAHAYGIPTAWAEMSDRVIGKGFKFRDYESIYLQPNMRCTDIRTMMDYSRMDFFEANPNRITYTQNALLNSFPDKIY